MVETQNQNLEQTVAKMVELMGLSGVEVAFDKENKKLSILAGEEEWLKRHIPELVKDFKHLINIIARKRGEESYFVDINNYRKEREYLIAALAKAAAQKTTSTKQEVRLPAMNSYERRLVHTELAMRPDVKTESMGEGRERCVVVKPL